MSGQELLDSISDPITDSLCGIWKLI